MLFLRKPSLLAVARRAGAFTRHASTGKLSLEALAKRESLKGKRVLVRADLNVPIKKKHVPPTITDDTRIRAVLPTLQLLKKEGAKVGDAPSTLDCVLCVSHSHVICHS